MPSTQDVPERRVGAQGRVHPRNVRQRWNRFPRTNGSAEQNRIVPCSQCGGEKGGWGSYTLSKRIPAKRIRALKVECPEEPREQAFDFQVRNRLWRRTDEQSAWCCGQKCWHLSRVLKRIPFVSMTRRNQMRAWRVCLFWSDEGWLCWAGPENECYLFFEIVSLECKDKWIFTCDKSTRHWEGNPPRRACLLPTFCSIPLVPEHVTTIWSLQLGRRDTIAGEKDTTPPMHRASTTRRDMMAAPPYLNLNYLKLQQLSTTLQQVFSQSGLENEVLLSCSLHIEL